MYDDFIHKHLRIHSYGSYLRRRFRCRVSKVNVDGGFTCPNRDGVKGDGGCVYCNNTSFSPRGTIEEIPVRKQMEDGMAYHRKRLGSEKFIIYFQKYTNTYGPFEKISDLYRLVLDHPDVLGISVGTRPDCLSDETLALLEEIARTHYVCLELGLQSMDDDILRRINRGHGLADYLRAVEKTAGRGIELCTHLIYGFPGETAEGFLRTADLVTSLPVDSLKIHQLHAVEGTRLAEMYRSVEFVPLTHREYVSTVCDFLERIPSRITIQRLYGSAPLAIRVAPTWDLKNNQMWYSIINELKRRGTWQGFRLTGNTSMAPSSSPTPQSLMRYHI
jgi:radical SAM protein (TIGR01212 family)